MSLFRFLFRDIAVDLGTANTLVYVRGRGIVLQEPSVVAIDRQTGAVLAVGLAAKEMVGRTPGNIVAVRPLKDGVISDFDATQKMLKYFLHKAWPRRSALRPRIMVCVPSGVTGVEKRAVQDAAREAGAREVYLIDEPMAAAIGAGLPVYEPAGSMVVDIGGGTADIAVISLGGVVTDRSLRMAGDKLDDAIIRYVKMAHRLLIGERTAEEIKLNIGSADTTGPTEYMEIRGRDLTTGLPRTLRISSDEVREALRECVEAIVIAIKETLEATPPELVSDLCDRGIVMTGGTSLLRGLDTLVARETGMPVTVTNDALLCVAKGTGLALETRLSQKRTRALV